MKKTFLPLLIAAVWFLVAGSAGATIYYSADKADTFFGGALQDNLGLAAAVGDFNGDSFADVFIGAPGS